MQGDAEKLPSTTVTRPYQSASFQVSPGIERDRPALGMKPKQGHWYTGMEYNHENLTKSELNPFFYGVKLVHKLKSYTYQADALSANRGLNTSHYTNQHIYRVEWDPPAEDGTGGYIRWFTDDVLMYGITGSNLHTTGSEIPSEAMYLLMNTAVAASWGFPAPCPEGCKCKCFECGNPDCACALPTGYCENFPATFEIDYVRVFQALGEEKHTLGCSPVNRPTSLFIKGHQKRYMEKGDTMPILPVQKGGATCRENKDCGTIKKGHCSARGFCVCKENSTGPNCLAHAGFYIKASISEEESTLGCECNWLYCRLSTKTELEESVLFNFLFSHLLTNCCIFFSFVGSKLYIPTSLIAWISLLSFFLLFSAFLALRDRMKYRHRRHHNYQKVDHHHSMIEQTNSATTYQNSSDYALPTKQKVITYCVVDGRLIDK